MTNHPKNQALPEQKSIQVTFQLQGPILRQIIDETPRPPRDVAIEHISLWLTATQIQLARFRRSLRAELKMFPVQGSTRRVSSQRVHFDEHMLLSCAANLQKALDRFSGELPGLTLPAGFADLLRHLRNVYEHWEDYKPHVANPPQNKRSGKELTQLAPNAKPWALAIWPGDDIKIACVLSLRDLGAHLRALKTSVPSE